MYGDAHGVGYLLDPRYIGSGISQQVSNKIEDFISAFSIEDGSVTSEEEKVAMSQEYTQWKIKAMMKWSNKLFCFKILGSWKTILQYWQSDGTQNPTLQHLAIKVFSMPASSTASQQVFSMFGFIHSKLQNSLGLDKEKGWSTLRSKGCSYQTAPMLTMNPTMITTVAQDLNLETIKTCNKVIQNFLHFSSKNLLRVKEEFSLIYFNWY